MTMEARATPARRRIRVLHVIQNLNYGGMERLVADLVRGLNRDRFESHILVLQYPGRFARGLNGAAQLHLSGPLPRWTMLWPKPMVAQIRAIAPDVVHTHSGVWYRTSLAARLAGVPRLIHTDHGRWQPDPLMHRLLDRLASGRTDAVVAVSAALAEQLAATVVRWPERIRVVLNGVNTSTFRPMRDNTVLRRSLALRHDTPIIGSIGRLEPVKRYDLMIRAFAGLDDRWPAGAPPVLVIAGDGSERGGLEALAQRLGVRDRVFLLGWRDDVHDLHAGFDLFTLSSSSEGTSVSLLEAMSAGLCPVVTDAGGNRAVLGAGLAHRLVPAGDPEMLAVGWGAALENEPARRRDGLAARARVVTAFALERMVRDYEALYVGAEGFPPRRGG
jgi:glycosyltransferase involved in cell wall biosynthesis